MAKKPRDHKAEYARRIQKALKDGFTRTQARGHAKSDEAPISKRRSPKPLDDARLQRAIKDLRKNKKLSEAAKAARISPERLRAALLSKNAIEPPQ
jgi:hypothetical protein